MRCSIGTPLRERLLAGIKVNEQTGCWEWKGSRDWYGYGQMRVTRAPGSGSSEKTHRLAYVEFVGPIPDGMFVCHHCDNPPCCNPSHLFVGTARDNAVDRDRKQRRQAPRGPTHPKAKLSVDDVIEIRRARREDGVTEQWLADKYHIRQPSVSLILRRVNWKHVP